MKRASDSGTEGRARSRQKMRDTKVMRDNPTRRRLFAMLLLFVGAALLGLQGCALPGAPTDRYAIVIGVANYTYLPGDPCLYTDNDAVSMAETLTKTHWLVQPELISPYQDTGATYDYKTSATGSYISPTKSAIEKAFGDLATSLKAQGRVASTILVYFSGHGYQDPASLIGYLCPSDTTVALDVSSMITIQELDSWINQVPATNRMAILDSCYSGYFVAPGQSVDAAPPAYLPADGQTVDGSLSTALANASTLFAQAISNESDPSILTIAAAGARESSYGDSSFIVSPSTDPHGVFTWFLLQADQNAETNGDKLVTATEAFAYARSQVLAQWDGNSNNTWLTFLPHISGGSGDIVLYDNR